MEQPLEIHLAKPGGRKEGPFSLGEINLALAARKYRSEDYWAWHKGLEEWVPLYDVKGVNKVFSLAASLAKETERPNLQKESPGGQMPETPTLVGGAKEAVAPKEPPARSPGSELPKPVLQDSCVEDSLPDSAKEEKPSASMAAPVVQNAPSQPVETSAESIQAASPDPEPAEPLASLYENEGSEFSKDQVDEFVKEDLAAEELASCSPDVESSLSALEDSAPVLPLSDPAETEHEAAESPPATQKADAQTMESTAESMASDHGPVESGQQAVPDPEPGQPVEPLSSDEPSKVSKDEARDRLEKAETAATILARLKQNFFHGSEPANGVTSYFNARRAPLPGMADTGTPALGEEWGMPEPSHPLDFHSKAVPKVPEDGSVPGPETDPAAALLAQQFSSGMPFAALEQLFIFTTGDGRAIWNSPIMSRMLEAIVGENVERIRQGTPRDVIFNCDLSRLLKRDGAISDSVWHAMEIREPSVVGRAQKKLSRTCVRTFNLERDTVVALVLFYNNEKLENSSATLGPASTGTTRFTLPVNAGSSGSEHPQ